MGSRWPENPALGGRGACLRLRGYRLELLLPGADRWISGGNRLAPDVASQAGVDPGATTLSVTAGLSSSTPAAAASRSLTFGFTGGEQSFVVPAGATLLQYRLVGAPGADAETFGLGVAGRGGRGAALTGTLPITPLTTVYVEVGGAGQGSLGGFNGGGGGGHGAFSPMGGGGGAART